MRITLDHDQWDVSDDQLVGEILGQLSDRARARQRLVTSLKFDGRPITDRDLHPTLLAKLLKEVGPIEALSQDLPAIVRNASLTMTRFATTLTTEAQGFLVPLRTRGTIPAALDRWFGLLADYVELLQVSGAGSPSVVDQQAFPTWIQELLEARSIQDPVRMADILEFEILPRLVSV